MRRLAGNSPVSNRIAGREAAPGLCGVLRKPCQLYLVDYIALYRSNYDCRMSKKKRQAIMKTRTPQVQDLARVFGENVFVLRTHKGMSQTQVGDMVGTTRSHISEIEEGIINLRLTDMLGLADALGPTYEEMLTPGGALRFLSGGHERL